LKLLSQSSDYNHAVKVKVLAGIVSAHRQHFSSSPEIHAGWYLHGKEYWQNNSQSFFPPTPLRVITAADPSQP